MVVTIVRIVKEKKKAEEAKKKDANAEDGDATTQEELNDDEKTEKQIVKDEGEGEDDFDDDDKKKNEKKAIVSTPLEIYPEEEKTADEENSDDTPEEVNDVNKEKTVTVPQQKKGMVVPRMVHALPPRPGQPYPSSSSLFKIDTENNPITVDKPTLIEVMHTLTHRSMSLGGRNDMCCPCTSVKRDLEAEKKILDDKQKQLDAARKALEKKLKNAKVIDDLNDPTAFLAT